MKTLYIDCTNGVSGDMVLRALCDLAGTRAAADCACTSSRSDR